MNKNFIKVKFILVLASFSSQACEKSGGGNSAVITPSQGSSNDPPSYVGIYMRTCHNDDGGNGYYVSSKLTVTASQLTYIDSCFSDIACSTASICLPSTTNNKSGTAYYTILSTDNSNKSKLALSSCTIALDAPAACSSLFSTDSNSSLYVQVTAAGLNLFSGSSSNYISFTKN